MKLKRFLLLLLVSVWIHRVAYANLTKAEELLEAARQYHLRGDLVRAEHAYKEAAKLDARFAWAIVPIWDDQKKWSDIVALVESAPEISILPDWVLAPAAYAYWELGNRTRYDQLVALIEQRAPKDPVRREHWLFYMAYLSACRGDGRSAVSLINQIESRDVLEMAKRSKKLGSFQEAILARLREARSGARD